MVNTEHPKHRVAQTIGRCWDGGLQVYNHPLPRWWIGLLAAAVLAALTYWLLYPSWPVPGGHFSGVTRVELGNADDKVVVPWSSRADLQSREEKDELRIRRRRLVWGMSQAEYHTVAGDPNMLAFALATARTPYLDNCAACHAGDGRGVDGLGPVLAGQPAIEHAGFAAIERVIRRGDHGHEPGRSPLSGADGAAIAASCDGCHATPPRGGPVAGSVHQQGRSGAFDETMPAWGGRLSDLEIKALTLYVRELGRSG